MKAISDLGFTGYVTHEYSPTQGNNPIKELAKAMEICAVGLGCPVGYLKEEMRAGNA